MTTDWTADKVAERFEESVWTLRKLPSGLTLGYVNTWPTIKLEPREIARQESVPIPLKATPDQITRMEQTLTWIVWVNPTERHLIWLRAYRTPWRAIARKTGFPRTSAQRYWQGALLKIAERLAQERKPAG